MSESEFGNNTDEEEEEVIDDDCVQTVRMVQLLNCLLGAGRVLAFVLLLVVHVRIVRSFHLNYSVLLGAAIAGYALNGWTTLQLGAVLAIWPHLDYDRFPINILDKTDDAVYLLVIACTLLAMAERTVATVSSDSYERLNATPAGLALTLMATLLCCCCYVYFLDDRDSINAYIFLGISLVEFLVGTALFACNRHAFKARWPTRRSSRVRGGGVRSASGGRTLSTRYQLSENIRSLPPLISFVFLDALGTVVDYAAIPLFSVTVDFDEDSLCGAEKQYVAMRVISFFMKLLIPLALLVMHRPYRDGLLTLLKRLRGEKKNDASRPPPLRNVLGVAIVTSATADEYFRGLAAQWQPPPAVLLPSRRRSRTAPPRLEREATASPAQ